MFQTPPFLPIPAQLLPYLSEPTRPPRHPIFDLNPARPVDTTTFAYDFQRSASPATPSPIRKRNDISPLSSKQDTSHLAPPSTPTSPSRKVIRVESPIKEDGPPVDIEILERENSFREIVIRPQTPHQTEKRILLPDDLHPALVDAYIVKVVYKAMEEERNRIWDEMQKVIEDQRRFGFDEAIELVMETCDFELSIASKRFLMALVGKRYTKQSTVPKFWRPPPYHQVEDYIDKTCDDNVIITLGTLGGVELRCGMGGVVECLDMYHCEGEAVLRYPKEGGGERTRKVKVLGEICPYGVALLLDELGNTWLYSVPGAMGHHLKEFKHRLGMFLHKALRNGLTATGLV